MNINTELGSNQSGFFGLVHLTPFTQVEFSGNSNIFDAFRLDNLIFAAAPTTTDPVPEPSTMVLLGTGLASMVAWRFKKQHAKN